MEINEKPCGKCMKHKHSCQCGRPLFDGKNPKEVLSKLDYAFAYCLNNQQAALYAGISESAFYRIMERQPKIRERRDRLKIEVNLKLRKIVLDAAEKDAGLAFKLLERLDASEFAPSSHRPVPQVVPDAPKKSILQMHDERFEQLRIGRNAVSARDAASLKLIKYL